MNESEQAVFARYTTHLLTMVVDSHVSGDFPLMLAAMISVTASVVMPLGEEAQADAIANFTTAIETLRPAYEKMRDDAALAAVPPQGNA